MYNEYNEYNEDVDYSELRRRRYRDQPGTDFFVCPKCGREYTASFFYNEGGEIVCVECANAR